MEEAINDMARVLWESGIRPKEVVLEVGKKDYLHILGFVGLHAKGVNSFVYQTDFMPVRIKLSHA